MHSYNTKSFRDGLKQLNIDLSDYQIKQFMLFYEMVVEWNKVMNLTGITEFEDVIRKHFLDSLAIVQVCDMNQTRRVIDVGTGAGFPGIPLKIAFPHLDIVLLDSLKKRVFFLDEVIAQLNLKMVQVIHGRAEDYAGQKEYREIFDLSVSRAVANLSPLSEYCLPFVAVKGKFVAYKSGNIEDELKESEKAINVLGGRVSSCLHFPLFDTDAQRSFVVVDKTETTPSRYPRKAGLPVKDPI